MKKIMFVAFLITGSVTAMRQIDNFYFSSSGAQRSYFATLNRYERISFFNRIGPEQSQAFFALLTLKEQGELFVLLDMQKVQELFASLETEKKIALFTTLYEEKPGATPFEFHSTRDSIFWHEQILLLVQMEPELTPAQKGALASSVLPLRSMPYRALREIIETVEPGQRVQLLATLSGVLTFETQAALLGLLPEAGQLTYFRGLRPEQQTALLRELVNREKPWILRGLARIEKAWQLVDSLDAAEKRDLFVRSYARLKLADGGRLYAQLTPEDQQAYFGTLTTPEKMTLLDASTGYLKREQMAGLIPMLTPEEIRDLPVMLDKRCNERIFDMIKPEEKMKPSAFHMLKPAQQRAYLGSLNIFELLILFDQLSEGTQRELFAHLRQDQMYPLICSPYGDAPVTRAEFFPMLNTENRVKALKCLWANCEGGRTTALSVESTVHKPKLTDIECLLDSLDPAQLRATFDSITPKGWILPACPPLSGLALFHSLRRKNQVALFSALAPKTQKYLYYSYNEWNRKELFASLEAPDQLTLYGGFSMQAKVVYFERLKPAAKVTFLKSLKPKAQRTFFSQLDEKSQSTLYMLLNEDALN